MTNEQKTSSKKITVSLILSWIFWIIFGLTGIVSVFSEPIPGVVMLVMAAILLPPINRLVDKKWKIHLSGGLKIALIVLGFIIYGITIDTSNISSTQKVETNEQKNIETEIIPTSNEEKADVIEEKPEPTKEATIPAEYKSALNKARMYAKTMHMSKQGVYDQLVSEYGEKFSAEAGQYAIDNMKADWNVNALVKAKTYQDTMNMSPAAIHDQLTSEYGEKFTKAEADYAIQHLND